MERSSIRRWFNNSRPHDRTKWASFSSITAFFFSPSLFQQEQLWFLAWSHFLSCKPVFVKITFLLFSCETLKDEYPCSWLSSIHLSKIILMLIYFSLNYYPQSLDQIEIFFFKSIKNNFLFYGLQAMDEFILFLVGSSFYKSFMFL